MEQDLSYRKVLTDELEFSVERDFPRVTLRAIKQTPSLLIRPHRVCAAWSIR